MKNRTPFLRRPYPIDHSPVRSLVVSLAFGMFIFLFLRLFEPFGIASLKTGKTLVCLEFGTLSTIVILTLNLGLTCLFPRLFLEKNWTTGKELLWMSLHFVLIGFGNALVAVHINFSEWSWELLLTYEIYTLGVGIFPVTISLLITEVRLSKRYQTESVELNTHLHTAINTDTPVVLPSDNKNEDLTLIPDQLIYLEAADNYVTVYFLENEAVRKAILRSTLKTQETSLAAIPTLFRAHKSYLINCNHIECVSGNAQGYKLHLKGITASIPVSRKQNQELRKRLG